MPLDDDSRLSERLASRPTQLRWRLVPSLNSDGPVVLVSPRMTLFSQLAPKFAVDLMFTFWLAFVPVQEMNSRPAKLARAGAPIAVSSRMRLPEKLAAVRPVDENRMFSRES